MFAIVAVFSCIFRYLKQGFADDVHKTLLIFTYMGFRFLFLTGDPSVCAGAVTGIPLDPAKVNNVVSVGPRRIYRLDSVGTIQRTAQKKIEVHVRAVWDTQHFNQNPAGQDPNDFQGTWVYWRED